MSNYLWPRQRENISAKTLMALKPRIFSPANLSPSTVCSYMHRVVDHRSMDYRSMNHVIFMSNCNQDNATAGYWLLFFELHITNDPQLLWLVILFLPSGSELASSLSRPHHYFSFVGVGNFSPTKRKIVARNFTLLHS